MREVQSHKPFFLGPSPGCGQLQVKLISSSHAFAAETPGLEKLRHDAERGLAEAQSNLGAMYANGTGVPRNYATAHMWVNLAAARNDQAKKSLDVLKRSATSDQVTEGQKMAREWTATHTK